MLTPGETFQAVFEIGLRTKQPYTFLVGRFGDSLP